MRSLTRLAALPAAATFLTFSACKPMPTPLPDAPATPTPLLTATPPAATAPVAEPPRWALDAALLRGEPATYLKSFEPLLRQIAEGAPTHAVVAELRQQLAAAPTDLEAAITPEGALPGPVREQLVAASNAAFVAALLWRLEGKPEDAERAKRILLRFAEVFPQWPLHGPKNARAAQESTQPDSQWDAWGFWARWYPLDLSGSIPLLRAYDLIRPTLSEEERTEITRRIFEHQKERIDRFHGSRSYHNTAGYHLLALARFAQVLDRADWMQEAIDQWRLIIHRGYTPDGYYREVTPDYHFQITTRMTQTLPGIVQQYAASSKEPMPDLAAEAAPQLARMEGGILTATLPDGHYLNTNDSWPKRHRATPPPPNQPGLLGGAGLARLAVGGQTLFLKFHGIRGHDHQDALSLTWYAGGREVFSETGYRPQKGEFDRAWSAATASHLTAAIDGVAHFTERNAVDTPARLSTFLSRVPKTPGRAPVEAAYDAAARYRNQGALRLWHATSPLAQAVEADQPEAYPGLATRFRRTLVLIPFTQEDGMVVDLFRIHGGKRHDYFLRGGLDEAYTLETVPTLPPQHGTEYQWISLREGGPVKPPLKLVATYGDAATVTSHLASVGGGSLSCQIGEAPAIRRDAKAPWAILRHEGEALESTFAWVHEAARHAPRIERVESVPQSNGGQVLVITSQGGRRDFVFTAPEPLSFEHEGWRFHGTLAWACEVPGSEAQAVVFSPGFLEKGALRQEGTPHLSGALVATHEATPQEPVSTLRFRAEEGQPGAAYRVAHLDFEPGLRLSIPVHAVRAEGGEVLVELAYPAGFTLEEGRAVFSYYPGWSIAGGCRVTLE